MLIGCIADDFTGATDLANTLVKSGISAIQIIGVPGDDLVTDDADAVVVALKSRTIPAAEAVKQSLAALGWLRARGAQQIIFKYCSTFDSTDEGNIGPVADALQDAVRSDIAIACPAFPATGRSIYKGYLFVGDVLLSESGMQDHPLTPMTDPNLVRVLGRQTDRPVGLVESRTVADGAAAVVGRLQALKEEGKRYAIVDALSDDDLMTIGAAMDGYALVTGGSGIAMGLAENFRRRGALGPAVTPVLPAIKGKSAVIAGSCSRMTRAQVARTSKVWPSMAVDPRRIAAGDDICAEVLAWVDAETGDTPVLIYSSAAPEEITAIQNDFGRERAGEMVEREMGRIARGLIERGVNRLVVAGGETSGAVVSALQVRALRIGPEIDPGVPWTEAVGGVPLALALKSGNFGGEDFFERALGMLP